MLWAFFHEEHIMMGINLFDPAKPSIYGTATVKDIIHVCLIALLFTACVMSLFSVLIILFLMFRE